MLVLFFQSGSLLQEADAIPKELCLLKHKKKKQTESFDRLFLASYGLVAVKSVNKKWTGDLGEYLQTTILRRSKGALLMNLLSYWLIFLEIPDTWRGVKKMKG